MSELRSPEEAGVTSFPTTAFNIAACNWCGSSEIDPTLAVVPGNQVGQVNFCSDEHRKEFFRGRP